MSKSKHDKPQNTAVVQAQSFIETSRQEIGTDSEALESRRRFTKAGLLAPPVLMSLASRPVLGGGIPCISNMLSGNLSTPLRGACELGFQDPSGWLVDNAWPTSSNLLPGVTIDKGDGPGGQELTCDNCSAGGSGLSCSCSF